MKAILEFNLPEETDEFALACEAGKVHSALWEFDQALRTIRKHGTGDRTQQLIDAWFDATEGINL